MLIPALVGAVIVLGLWVWWLSFRFGALCRLHVRLLRALDRLGRVALAHGHLSAELKDELEALLGPVLSEKERRARREDLDRWLYSGRERVDFHLER